MDKNLVTPISPNWWTPGKVVAVVIGVALVLDSVVAVWGERRPVGGFFEELIARSGHYVIVIGAFFGAVFGGIKATEKTSRRFVGWFVGIILFLIIGGGGMLLLSSIPGVDWRYERLQESMESDY